MLKEISLHIMDIAENGIAAGAGLVRIHVDEQRTSDRLLIKITDDGKGIPEGMIDRVVDPFVTSRKTRRVGLGLSLLKAAAERCDGRFVLSSEPGEGTSVEATFRYSHIDRAPLGDMGQSIGVLIIGNPDTDFLYTHRVEEDDFGLDTREIRREVAPLTLTNPKVYQHLVQTIGSALADLETAAGHPE